MCKQNRPTLHHKRGHFCRLMLFRKPSRSYPGLPLGAATIVYSIWGDWFLKFNPRNPSWADRDRFV